jgi:hypothetical protein
MMYPLAEYDGTMKSMDWSKLRELPNEASRRRRGEMGQT